jgi:hypothetical protein
LKEVSVIHRSIRVLPVPLASEITLETVREIKAIPDDEIQYTQEEVDWMVRALQNLEHMRLLAEQAGLETGDICTRIGQIQEQLQAARER